jgi:outer membrane protein assembly factor BamB
VKRVLALLCLVLLSASADGVGWRMVQKDSQHTGSVAEGPDPPLKRAWVATSDDPDSSFTTWPVVADGVVYARSGPGVLAVEAESGRVKWWRENDEGSTLVAPSLDEERLYISVPFGHLLALDRETGEEVWRFTADDSLDASAVVDDGMIFVGSADAKVLYGVNDDGRLEWKVATEFEPNSVPTASDGVIVASTDHLGSDRVLLLGLATDSGNELWRVEQVGSNSSPSILNGKVVFGGGDFFAYALDLETGEEVWKSPVEGRFGIWSMPALAFGDVFLADRVGGMYRLDGETGERKWKSEMPDDGTLNQSFPVIAGNTMFIGSGSGWIYAVDTEDGSVLWKEQVGGFVLSGAADSERFYFGVKFRNEGLYAYEHDPEGILDPPDRTPGTVEALLGGLVIAALIIGGLVIYARIRRTRSQT